MGKKSKGETYAKSGVDIAAGDKAVDLIKPLAERTFCFAPGEIVSGIGRFSATARIGDRIFLFSTDGVGTKLILAILMNKHDTVGIDLVAMCVNDIAMSNVGPAFFLDYIAMGKQYPEKTAAIIKGIIDGCEQAECALVGGEMAEMPGMYVAEDYDLAGFAVGIAKESELILSKDIQPGMNVYGLPSSGVHSNGYSLIRRIFEIDLGKPRQALKKLEKFYPQISKTLGEELLRPTKIYVKEIKYLVANHRICGMAHITGGGLIENPPRILPKGCAIEINKFTWPTPPIFDLIAEKGKVAHDEMMRVFNNGVGTILISPDEIPAIGVFKIGRVVESKRGKKKVSFIWPKPKARPKVK